MKTCVFVTSFKSRLELIKEFISRFKQSGVDLQLFIFCDAPNDCKISGVTWVEDAYHFTYASRINALMYRLLLRFACRIRKRAIPYSNNLLGYTPLWGRRLDSAIRFMTESGYTHAIWCCDDGWFSSASSKRLKRMLDTVQRHSPGYFRLTESLSKDGKVDSYQRIAEDTIELFPSLDNLHCHFVSHQTCLWDLKVLGKISNPLDCACRHENSGTYRFYRGGFRAMEYEGTPIIPSLGVYSDEGFSLDRIEGK